MEAVNALLVEAKTPGIDDSDDSKDEVWNGISDDHPLELIDHEAEYIDEDRYTTVTVEAVDVSKEGLHKVAEDEDSEEDEFQRPKDTGRFYQSEDRSQQGNPAEEDQEEEVPL